MDSVDRLKQAFSGIRGSVPRPPGQPDLIAPAEGALEDLSYDLDAISVVLKALTGKAGLSTADIPGYATLAPAVKRRVDGLLP